MLFQPRPGGKVGRSDIPDNCPFCRHPQTEYWFSKRSKHDDQSYSLYRCSGCHGAFVFPVPTEEELHELYSGTQNTLEARLHVGGASDPYEHAIQEEADFPNSTIDAKRIAENLKRLSPGLRALDVGSGYGFFSRALMQQGFAVDALELGEESKKIHARMNGFDPIAEPFDDNFARKKAGTYDAILLSQVLEHLPMDADPIRNLNVLLKKDGICAIAIPLFRSYLSNIQGRNDMFITPPDHLNHFTRKSLDEAFARRGFQAVKYETVSRYDYRRFKQRFGALAPLPELALRSFFAVSDLMGRGMFLNGYFKKLESAA